MVRHSNKELDAVIRDMEQHGWAVTRGGKYYKGKCGCGRHVKTVKCSPSDPNYERNLRGWLGRLECWENET